MLISAMLTLVACTFVQDTAQTVSAKDILAAADRALAEANTLAYSAHYERAEKEPNTAPGETQHVQGEVWLARHDVEDRLGWKIVTKTSMTHRAVKHEGVYAHWAYDGDNVTLIFPEKKRAQLETRANGKHSVIVDFFRGSLLPEEFRDWEGWERPRENPFQSILLFAQEARLTGTQNFQGVDCYSIDIVFKPSEFVTESVQHWLFGIDDGIPRFVERRWVFDRTETREALTLTDVRLNVWIDHSMFLPKAPEGYTLTGARAEGEKTAENVEAEIEQPAVTEKLAEHPQTGEAAPDFALKDHTGREHTLADYRGKLLLLDFWGTWCGPCRMAMPGLQKMHERFSERGLVVMGISGRERPGADPAGYLTTRGYTFPTLLEGDAVARRYGVRAWPTTVLIDESGKVLSCKQGYSLEEQEKLSKIIEEHLSRRR